jgi:hypothetical protein
VRLLALWRLLDNWSFLFSIANLWCDDLFVVILLSSSKYFSTECCEAESNNKDGDAKSRILYS